MSFSSDIKQELNNLKNLSNKELVKYELIGYLLSGNIDIDKNNLEFTTENDYNINRFSKLLSNLNINHNIDVSGKIFIIIVKKKEISEIVKIENNKIYFQEEIANIKNQELLKAIVRGMYLGSGSVNNPENKYHLEVTFSNESNMELAISILEKLGIKTKKMIMKNKYYLYIKEGEEISIILALIGANTSVMKFEEIRIQIEMRGKDKRILQSRAQ